MWFPRPPPCRRTETRTRAKRVPGDPYHGARALGKQMDRQIGARQLQMDDRKKKNKIGKQLKPISFLGFSNLLRICVLLLEICVSFFKVAEESDGKEPFLARPGDSCEEEKKKARCAEKRRIGKPPRLPTDFKDNNSEKKKKWRKSFRSRTTLEQKRAKLVKRKVKKFQKRDHTLEEANSKTKFKFFYFFFYSCLLLKVKVFILGEKLKGGNWFFLFFSY